jgi:hypothetical protein
VTGSVLFSIPTCESASVNPPSVTFFAVHICAFTGIDRGFVCPPPCLNRDESIKSGDQAVSYV